MHYISERMKRLFLGLIVLVVIAVGIVIAVNRQSPSSAAPPATTHAIKATSSNMAELKAAFLKFKIHNHEMAKTDRIKWSQIISPHGPNRPLLAYDAVDHRDWAIASFALISPASYTANVSFQDGGNMGIFNKVGSGKWVMIGSPGFPLCAKDVPSPVAQVWSLKNYPACA